MKKSLIALLSINALLIALLTAQAAQAATAKVKTYDAVQLAEYESCIKFFNQNRVGEDFYGGYPELFGFHVKMCARYKP